MNQLEINTLLNKMYENLSRENWLRKGQCFMNALSDYNFVAYKTTTGTDYDCFYDDKKIPKTIEYLLTME